jgi:hypothetical protein
MSKPEPDNTEVEFESETHEAEETERCNIHLDQEGNYIGTQACEYLVEKVEGGLKLIRPDRITMFLRNTVAVSIENLIGKLAGTQDSSAIESIKVQAVDQFPVHRKDFTSPWDRPFRSFTHSRGLTPNQR